VGLADRANAWPADEFVRWAFNETPGDSKLSPTILFLAISPFSPFFIAHFWPLVAHVICFYASLPYVYANLPMVDHVIVRGITYDFVRYFVFHSSRHDQRFPADCNFFPFSRHFSCPFSGISCTLLLIMVMQLSRQEWSDAEFNRFSRSAETIDVFSLFVT